MLDPDDPKSSFLNDLLWTEKEFKELLRAKVCEFTDLFTFEPYLPAGTNTRTIEVTAVIMQRENEHKNLLSNLRARLRDLPITISYGSVAASRYNLSSDEQWLTLKFTAPRFRPLE